MFAEAGPSTRIAVLGIELIKPDTMNMGTSNTPQEEERLRIVAQIIEQALATAGYAVVDPAMTRALVASDAGGEYLHACNGCELDLGRKLGANWVVVGWIQLVSNLILNLNVLVFDVDSGALVGKAFVDLRGNTERSWRRATHYLLKNDLLERLEAQR